MNLLDQFVKQQGVAVWGENDEPEEFLLSLLPPHELIIHVEHCLHTRPSRTGSLRGSAQMYMDQSQLLEAALKPLQGGGSVTVVANDRARARHQLGGDPASCSRRQHQQQTRQPAVLCHKQPQQPPACLPAATALV